MSRLIAAWLLATSVSIPALAQKKSAAAAVRGPDIVVTAFPLKTAQAALAACLERHCPPNEDIDATLALAETQFVAGDYKAARGVMLKSIGRNKRFAKAYPVPVSDLLRANSRVAAHLGETGDYFSGALDVVSALKAGLPAEDARVLGARVELADAYARTGRTDGAVELYHQVAKRAHTLGQPRVEGYALLRVAALYAALSRVRDDPNAQAALNAADTLIATKDPALAGYAQAAKLLKANLAVKHGESGAVDRLIAEYRSVGAGSPVPVLLYAPTIQLRELSGREGASGETLNQMALDDFDNQWVDVSFQIAPDGRVGDVDVLRKSAKLEGDWVKPILTAVAGRRYAPLATDSAGAFRVERYSFTSSWTTVTGSRMRVRSPIPRIEVVDLSRDPATTGS